VTTSVVTLKNRAKASLVRLTSTCAGNGHGHASHAVLKAGGDVMIAIICASSAIHTHGPLWS
jgi:hypothetical protein